MNLLFLSPHFPPQFWLFCRALGERGVRVLGIGDAPGGSLRSELLHHLDDYVIVHDMNRRDDVVRAAQMLAARHGPIDAVESHNEHWLGLEAHLRSELGVEGPTPDDVALWQSKSRMGDRFAAAGLVPPRGVRAETARDVEAFVGAHGLPVVVKPDVGVGATGARAARDQGELALLLDGDLTGTVVQEALTGELVTFDGLTGRDGGVLFASSFRYSAGVLEMQRDRSDVVYHTRRTITPQVADLGERALRAFDVRSRFFHIEMFQTPDGAVRPLEINVRPPGGWSLDLMDFAADVDLYRMWAGVIAGAEVAPVPLPHRYFSAHVGRRGERRYRRSIADLRSELGPALMAVPEVPAMFGAVMGDPIVLLRHEDEAALRGLIDRVTERA
jgi:hypothetical protein